ncbi:MAG: hypothetical protein P8104_09325, partial [Gammaproteobacteria bacterium]
MNLTRHFDNKSPISQNPNSTSEIEEAKAEAPPSIHHHALKSYIQDVLHHLELQEHENHALETRAPLILDTQEALESILHSAEYGQHSAAHHGIEGLKELFNKEAEALHHAPLEVLNQTATAENTTAFALSGAVTILVAPLAIKTLYSAIKTLYDTQIHAKSLKVKNKEKQDIIHNLDQIKAATAEIAALGSFTQFLNGKHACTTQQIQDLRHATEQNKLSKATALTTAVAASTMTAGVVTKFATQAGLLGAAAGDFEKVSHLLTSSTSAVAASTAASTAVTLLAPVTALAITGIGILFAIKTHKKNKNLLERSTPTKCYLDAIMTKDDNLLQYIDFSTTKIKQREAFYKEFERYNKLFIAASALYSGSAIGKAIIIGTALAGVGLLSNPVTIAGTAAVGIVAGLGMALTSHHLITGHNKQHRYEKYVSKDSKLLNRDFLVSADLLASREEGLQLRAGLYQLIKKQDCLR